MTIDILFDQFDHLITRAEDIPRLNELILQLAVQGKLVSQNRADEPAAELLERITAEKQRLVKEKKIRKPKTLPPISDDETPFDLPVGWVWVRLPEVYHDCGQTKPNKSFTYIDVSSINNVIGVIGEDLQVIEPADAPSRARKRVGQGTVIYSTVRPYLLNIAIVDREFNPPPIVSTAFAVMHPFRGVDNKFLFFYLRSKPFIEFVESQMTGMAYPAISDSKLSNGLFPLPPLAEQQRIVERVEQLLDQSRALEAELAAAEAERARLTQASLHHLTAAPTPAVLREQWQQLAPTFDALLTDPAAVDDLKQAILQLAVQGRLVEQNPADEPAGELLERIKAEKARLVKEKKIRKSKPLPPVTEDEMPFEVPEGWEWVRLDEISDIGTGSTPLRSNKEFFTDGTIAWVTSSATNDLFIEQASEHITEDAVEKTRLRLYPKHTLVVALYGQGKTRGQISELLIEATINQACAAIVFENLEPQLGPYIKLFFLKNYQELRKLAEGGAQPNLNVGKVKNVPIPLPPLAEQRHIVERVEHLLALCDDLQAQLAAGETARIRLLESLLWRAANGQDA